jgi:protein-S-isoprenylcysteine O-methyltransferase Ste14
MELFPDFQLGWLNGWLLLALLVLTDAVLFISFQKGVVKRLFDRSGWTTSQIVLTWIGKLISLGVIVIIIMTPLKVDQAVFYIGLGFVVLGLAGLVKSLFDFRAAPPEQPATGGIYQITRHPQNMASSLVILGCIIAVGSWVGLAAFLVARVLLHANLVAEEQICLSHFGKKYQQYLDQTPRYFFF